MLIRAGWVSNSSTTSFMILGDMLNNDHIADPIDLVDRYNQQHPDDPLKLIAVFSGISDYAGRYFVGAGPNCMLDDETLREFKERVAAEINKLGVMTVTPELMRWWSDAEDDG